MAARLSSRDALCDLVRVELSRLYRVAHRLTGNSTRAEDLVGATLLAAAKGWAGFDGAHPSAWLIRIMTNTNFRLGTTEAKHRHAVLDSIPNEPVVTTTETMILNRITAETVLEGLQKLSAEQRMVIILCDIEELTYEEVALALDIPRGTVCSRLYRARKALTDCTRFSMEIE